VVVDLGSTNGTLVNDQPVAEATLEEGDRITIGRTVLEFRRT
jgi:pSer/pThr/pTyr-binding forkhead associated (FHA) protein